MKPYPKYKDSGIEWIGEIPRHWDFRKLSRSLDFIRSGSTPISDNPKYYEEGTVSWIQSGDLNDGIIKKTKKKVTEFALAEYSTLQVYPKGCLIIAMYGATIGKLGIMDFDGCCNQACCVMKGSNFFLIKYLYYWFFANKLNIIQLSIGGGQPNISQDIIKSLKITCPPIEEQKQIVGFLNIKVNEIDDLISKKQRMIELLKEQRAAVINEAVTKGLDPDVKMKPACAEASAGRDSGVEWCPQIPITWQIRPVKSNFDIQLGKMLQNEANSSSDEKVSYLKALNVNWNRVDVDDLSKMWASHTDLIQYGIKHMDLLVCEGGEVGRAGIVYNPPDKCIIQNALHRVRAKKNAQTGYLLYVLFAIASVDWFSVLCNKATIAHFTREKFAELLIPNPSNDEQVEIVKYLDTKTTEIDEIIKQEYIGIEILKEYRISLISEVVTGKIKIKSEQIEGVIC